MRGSIDGATWGEEHENTELDEESTEEVYISDIVGTCNRVNKEKADRKIKARTKTWYDVVKGLMKEDKLDTTNSTRAGTNRR